MFMVISMFWGLLLAFIVGLFFLVGIIFLKYVKNEDKWISFSIALAFVVMINLLLFDLLPELIEQKNIYLIIPAIIGFSFFILLDKLIPHHHEHGKKEHELHLNHIGIITILALFLHNFIEGFTLYNITITNITSGILMMISISLHNIPLGFQIGTHICNDKKSIF